MHITFKVPTTRDRVGQRSALDRLGGNQIEWPKTASPALFLSSGLIKFPGDSKMYQTVVGPGEGERGLNFYRFRRKNLAL